MSQGGHTNDCNNSQRRRKCLSLAADTLTPDANMKRKIFVVS